MINTLLVWNYDYISSEMRGIIRNFEKTENILLHYLIIDIDDYHLVQPGVMNNIISPYYYANIDEKYCTAMLTVRQNLD